MSSSSPLQHRLRVKVIPNAARDALAGWQEDGSLKVRIQAPAQDGKANKALVAFLARQTGVSKNQISIVQGQASRQKVVAFDRLSPSQFEQLPRP